MAISLSTCIYNITLNPWKCLMGIKAFKSGTYWLKDGAPPMSHSQDSSDTALNTYVHLCTNNDSQVFSYGKQCNKQKQGKYLHYKFRISPQLLN